ncbi:MAG: PQQ-binding-like beta-propeller repeat protein [Gemmata sp.]
MRPLLALLGFSAGALAAADWPQYRGPNRDDLSAETGLLKVWPKAGPPLLWIYDGAGVGYSPPAVVGDRVYVTGGREDHEFLIALDLKTTKDGAVKEAWAAKIGPTFRFPRNSWSAGPSAAPTVADGLIYALGGNGDLICADTTGKEKWRANLPKDFEGQVNPIGGGPKNLGWGFTGAPLVDGGNLIVAVGGPSGTLAALDRKTGKPVWRSTELTDQAAYTSPMPADFGGVKQYVILTNQGLAGVAAKDGKLLWTHKRKQPYGTEVINTPIIAEGHIFTTVAAGNGASELVRVEKVGEAFKVSEVYSNKNLLNHHGNVVLVGKHLYGFGNAWTGLDFKSGEVVWAERKLPSGALTCADGHLYLYSEADGTAALIEASPLAWKETGRFKIPKASTQRQPQGKVWTPPVVANGNLFLRDQELLFCFDVKAK